MAAAAQEERVLKQAESALRSYLQELSELQCFGRQANIRRADVGIRSAIQHTRDECESQHDGCIWA